MSAGHGRTTLPIYRMVTTIVIWVMTTIMVVLGKLHEREVLYVLTAAGASTVVTWWERPAAAQHGSKSEQS